MLGAGAIGASVGALLYEGGVDCVIVADPARSAHAKALVTRGVDLRFPDGSHLVRVPTVPVLAAASPAPDDLVLLATMAHHTAAALEGLDPAVPVVSFQNGLLPLNLLSARRHPTLAAMVYIPAERRGPGVVALPGVPAPGAVMVGEWGSGDATAGEGSVGSALGATAAWLADRLRLVGFRAESSAEIAPWIRAKLLTNLGGIVVALCDEPPMEVIGAAQAEAMAVWRAAGERFESVEALLAWAGPLETVPVDGVARRGGSTRSALARGDELETAALHGDVVAGGRRWCVPTPVNEALIAVAKRAGDERWTPGALAGAELLNYRVMSQFA